jgi:hypothetical protein
MELLRLALLFLLLRSCFWCCLLIFALFWYGVDVTLVLLGTVGRHDTPKSCFLTYTPLVFFLCCYPANHCHLKFVLVYSSALSGGGLPRSNIPWYV